jgi:hypothetical protein
MFKDVLENFRQATEATVHLQQEMFKKWITLWPSLPGPATWQEQAKQVQKKWAETMGDLIKRQAELTDSQFRAGLSNLDKAFQVAEAKTTEDVRAKSLELWQQCFDNLRKVQDAQVQAFEATMQKWCGNAPKAT